jgi:dienelactone hydrolase
VTVLAAALCSFGGGGCAATRDDGAEPPSADPAAPPEAPPAPPPGASSRCSEDPTTGAVACVHESTTIGGRQVRYQTPLGAAPAGGWPVVVVFQGSFFGPDRMWAASPEDVADVLGAVTQVRLIGALLDAGFAVITPAADANATAWDTNLPPWMFAWETSPDHAFLLELFAAIEAGHFGPCSATRWFATGASSGGYMTSRMAVSYPGRFVALAIAAGSYATCGGPACLVPALPGDHPPTLFLHGGADPLVPLVTMLPYRDRLLDGGIAARDVVDPMFRHGWIPAAPDEVVEWFQSW